MSEWKARVPRSVELLHHMPHLIPHRKVHSIYTIVIIIVKHDFCHSVLKYFMSTLKQRRLKWVSEVAIPLLQLLI